MYTKSFESTEFRLAQTDGKQVQKIMMLYICRHRGWHCACERLE